MARFELGDESVAGWLELRDDTIAFVTQRNGDRITERMRAPLARRGHPEAGDPPGEDDVRRAYVSFQRNCLAGGWRRVPDPPRERVHDEPREPALESALHDVDVDPSAWSVYADWLQDRGQVRGELIALALQAEDDRARTAEVDALRQAHAEVLLGRLAHEPRLSLTWERGFIASASLIGAHPIGVTEDILWELLRHPSARLLRRLNLPGISAFDSRLLVDVLLQTEAPPLTSLGLGTMLRHRHGYLPQLGDLQTLTARYPRLEELRIAGDNQLVLAPLHLPRARMIALHTNNMRRSLLDAFTDGTLPALEELDLAFGDQTECTRRDLELLLDGTAELPSLRVLRLTRMRFADDVCAMLARSPLARQLSLLDLGYGGLTDRGVAALLAVAGELRLRTLAIPGARIAETAAALAATGWRVITYVE